VSAAAVNASPTPREALAVRMAGASMRAAERSGL
jgi:hypothetical protein